jgi:glyoxylase-like metal-dependent hydrolase (beta-lactamase superfamily II)
MPALILRFRFALFLAICIASACTSRPDGPEAGRALLDQAASAMGGWSALDQVKSLEVQTSGTDWEPLQAVDPAAEPRQINSFSQTLLVDFAAKRMRLEFDATRTYPTAAPVKFVEVINGNDGMLANANERLHPSRLATRLRDYNRLPARVLYTARDAGNLTRSEDQTVEGGLVQVLKYTDSGLPVELHIDAESRLPMRVIYMEDDPIYGDTPNEVSFADWKDHSGVKLPETQITRLNGRKIREERVRSLVTNPPLDDASFAIPNSVKSQPENGERIVSQWALRRVVMGVAYQDFGREQKVDLVPVASGVYHIRGGSHHSMVVEMRDHLIVVEAPLFEERSVAVIRALEERFPGKPIKHLVVTHFHFDHSGGIRAYVAKGATILAHESILPFINDMIRRPHTLRPDSLEEARKKSTVSQSVGRISPVQVLTDGERRVEVRDIPSDHATGMTIVHLPKEKIVFVSDLYSPPGPTPNPSVIFERTRSQAFYDALKDAGLAVETIVGGHGTVGSLRDLERALAAAKE